MLLTFVGGALFFFRQKGTSQTSFATETQSGKVTIHMGDNSYEPVNIKIKAGTVVKFVNESKDYRWPASDLHPSHLIFPEFDAKGALAPGEDWDFVFEKAGEWGYHDHLAPYITGIITVVE